MNVVSLFFKSLFVVLVLFFISVNFLAYNHAYYYTHFESNPAEHTIDANTVADSPNLYNLFNSVYIAKSTNGENAPSRDYETVYVDGNNTLEGWLINVDNHKGTIVMFHGYASCKSNILNYANKFNDWGYSTLLMDFSGHGGSGGLHTTVGFHESNEVKATFDFVKDCYPNDEVILFGNSMGAVSIMKSIYDFDICPDKIIIQCPFGSMVKTLRNTFESMKAPTFPLAEIFLFYGGWHNGFNPFKHKPINYAKDISIPTLLLYGMKDDLVSMNEIKEIFNNIPADKELVLLNNSAHENYLKNDEENWSTEVAEFLDSNAQYR